MRYEYGVRLMKERAAKKRKAVESFLVYIVFLVLFFAFSGGTYAREADIALGKTLYKQQCVICHGAEGKGDGPAAAFLYPKPRDFTRGIFKIRSTPSLPTDEDLFRTISQGIPGTLMPSFEYLSEEERWALVAYVKSFSEEFEEAQSLEPITIPEPPPETPELMALGQALYKDAGCFQCHGARGKGDGPSAGALTDEWGDPIVPYDFTIPGRMKGGSSVEDIYRTLAVGIGGTPMPAYGDALSDEQIWAVAYYVRSFEEEAPPALLSGDAIAGRELFVGNKQLENGGASCRACHSFKGIGALGGGTMGPDLTPSYSKFGGDGLATILTDLPFPVMRGVFGTAELSEAEKANLIAFLAQGEARAPDRIFQLAGLGVAGAVICYLIILFLWRNRGGEVRRFVYAQSYQKRGGFADGLDKRPV